MAMLWMLIAQGLAGLVGLLRNVPQPILAGVAWAIALLGLWQVLSTGRETLRRSQAMHRIPCADCQFFTNDHRLKCPVHPQAALTTEAIGCRDFEA
jgi:hypothetical protein